MLREIVRKGAVVVAFDIRISSERNGGRGQLVNWVNREGAKDAKRVFLLVCFDPGRKTQDQDTPSPDGRLLL